MINTKGNWQGNQYWEERVNPSLKRLKGLIASRFSKELIIDMHADSRVSADVDLVIDLGFNIGSTAIILDGLSLDSDQKRQIHELIELILIPTLEGLALAQDSERRESAILLSEYNKMENVIPLRQIKQCLPSTSEMNDDLLIEEAEERYTIPGSALFLESKITARIFRISFKIHELSNRWAFLQWQDLAPQVTLEELKALGNLTILIPNLAALSESEIKLISEYVSQTNEPGSPLLLIGSHISLQDLVQNGLISEQFCACLEELSLKVDRIPMINVDLQDVLELLFRSPSHTDRIC